jgi:hypothetical protein
VNSFEAAAKEWNDIKFGVTITRTTDRAKANFVLVYYKPDPSDKKAKDVTASAFFPNQVKDLRCYNLSLTDEWCRGHLKNTFLHEIGHIIGLRHEFAIKGNRTRLPEKNGATQFGSLNQWSVMSYTEEQYIQETDKEDVLKFYKLPNGFEIDGVKVTDFIPKPLPVKKA